MLEAGNLGPGTDTDAIHRLIDFFMSAGEVVKCRLANTQIVRNLLP